MHLSEQLATDFFTFAPGDTAETSVGFVDLRDFGALLAAFVRSSGTSAVTFKLVASASADGSDPVDVKTKTFTAVPDAADDKVYLEVSDSEVAAAGDGLRYVSAVVSVATGTDTGGVVYIRGNAKHCTAGLSADAIA